MTVFTMFYSHSYLLYSSSHPLNVKNSVPFSQFLRLRRYVVTNLILFHRY